MESLKGKKLLILGGSAYMTESVLKAKSMGIYTVVTDWHEIERSCHFGLYFGQAIDGCEE